MARNHLRQHSGGHPSQGPVREMANPSPSPAAGNDFPDEPAEAVDERPEDRPDLDAFAAKLGLDDSDGHAHRSWTAGLTAKASATGDRAVRGLATGLSAVADRLQRWSKRLADR